MTYPLKMIAATKLKPYEKNARTHSQEQIDQIKDLIRMAGFVGPILYDFEADHIIAGHGRLLAVTQMIEAGEEIPAPGKKGMLPKGKLPCIDGSGMTDAERKAFVIADNQVAARAGWDFKLMDMEITELQAMDFDIAVLGFSDIELQSFTIDRENGGLDAAKEWQGMPAFDTKPRAFRSIVMHFDTEKDWKDFQSKIGQEFSDKAKYGWHPYKEKQDLQSQKWTGDDDAA